MSGVDPSTPKNRQFRQAAADFDGAASDRNADDMCSITGEVFSPQFLRNHAAGIPPAMSLVNDNHWLPSEDFKNGNIALRRMDSGGSNFLQRANSGKFENKGYNDNNDINRHCLEHERIGQSQSKFTNARYGKRAPSGLIVPPRYVASSPQLNQPAPESPMSGKMKFLCSFGGRILPRPSDGKLRYVGGETRIVSLRKDLTLEELMSKTSTICSQPYTIKYQLPGEDLDALISVCSNEDLNLMIEEYQEIERMGGQSQRLRIFLILLSELSEGPCFMDSMTAQQAEADHHYVYAVNGMLDSSTPRKDSGGHGGIPPGCTPNNYHRDSPTQVYNLENDYNPNSFNMAGMYSNPATAKLSQMPNNLYNQSPPVSPSTIYRREYENTNPQLYSDHRPPCDGSYYVDHKNYHDSPKKHMQMINYRHRNQYFADSSQAINRRGIHFHNRCPSSDVLPFPMYGQRDLSSEKPFLMERALSDSQLQEREIVSGYHLGEAINNDREISRAQQQIENTEDKMPMVIHKNLPELRNLPNTRLALQDHRDLGDKFPASNAREHSEGYQLNTTKPDEFCIKIQRTTNDDQVIETTQGRSTSNQNHGLQSTQSQQESVNRDAMMQSPKPSTNGSSSRGNQNVSNKERSYEKPKFEEDPAVQSQPISRISSFRKGVVSSQDEVNIELASTTGRGTDRVVSEPDIDSISGERKSKNESYTDAATSESEYGLQVVKDEDLEEVQELGSGTYGTVYYGKWRGTDVAIKRIKKSCFSGRISEQERLIRDFWREAQILSTLHHPNVVAFYGVVRDGPGGTMATVTEYMVSGSLRLALEKRDRALDRRKKLMITLDAAFGMEYLHFKNIVHFDLKCENLLVNLRDPHRPICKVGDFGLSRIKQNTLVTGGVRGTLPWMAPELLNGNNDRVTEKVDVFSFGIAMWEILTGEEPYANLHCGAIIGGIISNTLRPPIPERCDAEWKKLMEECWSIDPGERPSFTEITNRLRTMSIALQPKRRNYVNK
ncbi:hypothetical protein ACFE04_015394 [Oxalis oulophora]